MYKESLPGSGHQTHLGGLQVSGVLAVKVTAKAASPGPEHVRAGNFDALAVKENPEGLTDGVDQVDVVSVPLDFHDDLVVGVLDLVNAARLDANLFLAAFNVQLNLHLTIDRDQLDLDGSGQDLDLLFLTGQLLGQNSNRDALGAILEEQVVAVVQLVAEGLVVEGGDESGFDAARGGDLVSGDLLHQVVPQGVPHGDGQDSLQHGGHPQVDNLELPSHDLSTDLGLITNTADHGLQSEHILGGLAGLSLVHLTNKVGADELADPDHDGVLVQGLGQVDFGHDLVNGSGLVTGKFANIGEPLAFLFFTVTTSVFRGSADGFDLGLGFDHLGVDPEDKAV